MKLQRSLNIQRSMLARANAQSDRHSKRQTTSNVDELLMRGKMRMVRSSISAMILRMSWSTSVLGSKGIAMYQSSWKKIIQPNNEYISVQRVTWSLQRKEQTRKAQPIFLTNSIIERLEQRQVIFYRSGRFVSSQVWKVSQSILNKNIISQLNSFSYLSQAEYAQLTTRSIQISKVKQMTARLMAEMKKIIPDVDDNVGLQKLAAQKNDISWIVKQRAMLIVFLMFLLMKVLNSIFDSLQQILKIATKISNTNIPSQMAPTLANLLMNVSSVRKTGVTISPLKLNSYHPQLHGVMPRIYRYSKL